MKKFAAIIVIFLIFGSASSAFAEDKMHSPAIGNFYFDIATGHKYIKNPGTNTYKEYSKQGKLLRDEIPNDTPLLSTNKFIREVKNNCYLLYQKWNFQKKELMALSPEENHPNGWVCEKLLVTIN